jgi:hypothetical protein
MSTKFKKRKEDQGQRQELKREQWGPEPREAKSRNLETSFWMLQLRMD